MVNGDVLQTVYKILTHDAILDHLGMLSSLLAAIVHDLQHTGHTNDYLISVSHWLATRSNDISPHGSALPSIEEVKRTAQTCFVSQADFMPDKLVFWSCGPAGDNCL